MTIKGFYYMKREKPCLRKVLILKRINHRYQAESYLDQEEVAKILLLPANISVFFLDIEAKSLDDNGPPGLNNWSPGTPLPSRLSWTLGG